MSKVVIIVSGGNIQEIYCDTHDIDVTVIDHDNLAAAKHEDKYSIGGLWDLWETINYPNSVRPIEEIQQIINDEMKEYE